MSNKLEARTMPIWPDAAKLLGVSRNTAYRAVRAGQIPVIRIGGRLLVPRAALERMLEGQLERTTPTANG